MPKRKSEDENTNESIQKEKHNDSVKRTESQKQSKKANDRKSNARKRLNFKKNNVDINKNVNTKATRAGKRITRNSGMSITVKSQVSKNKQDCLICRQEPKRIVDKAARSNVKNKGVQLKQIKETLCRSNEIVNDLITDTAKAGIAGNNEEVAEVLGDGLVVTVETDEFDVENECETVVPVVEDDVRQVSSVNKDDDEVINLIEDQLLENPQLERYVNKLLDARLKQVLSSQQDLNNHNTASKESIRESTTQNEEQQPQPGTLRGLAIRGADGLDEARTKAERTVLEAEKFRATIMEPTGLDCSSIDHANHLNNGITSVNLQGMGSGDNYNIQGGAQVRLNLDEGLNSLNTKFDSRVVQKRLSLENQQIQAPHQQQILPDIGQGVSDDDFFHLICFTEPSLIHKIEKGEFVELEKLLPKDRVSNGSQSDDGRLEWVQRDGSTFLVPAGSKDVKIGSIRKWEQAFRVYVTIYCGANPHRAKEIWQYISVINTAAAAYSWDNVYNYDITFRHLMAFNPNRSWAVTYNRMWNLSMRDPLPKNHFNRGSFSGQHHNGNMSKVKGNGKGRKKSDYCWNINKGVPCKFGAKCRFIERCSYYDSPAHGINTCPKAKKENGQINGDANASGSN